MKIRETKLQGAFELSLDFSEDERGDFVKTLHTGSFTEYGLDSEFKESYFSTSKAGIIRGMHFQVPPHDHSKLVYAVNGAVLDVLLDIRKGSDTFGQCDTIELSKSRRNAVYIPKGIAHGFCVIEGSATLVYLTTTVYNKDSDTGVLWNSFGFNWPIDTPLLSERDKSFKPLDQFSSPF